MKTVFAFNIRQSVFRHFGLELFIHANKYYNMQLLPIVTTLEDGIQRRAIKIRDEMLKMMERTKQEKVHVAAYSTCGVDFRFAISELGLHKHCHTLSTIASPHKGSRLALLADRRFFKQQMIEPISRLAGVGLRPFHEFTPENMKYFNQFVHNHPSVDYFSIGAERLPNMCSYTLQETGKYLHEKTQTNMAYYNDGVFGHDQIVWGNHLVNFQADHGQVIGQYGKKRCLSLGLVQQTVGQWKSKRAKPKIKITANK